MEFRDKITEVQKHLADHKIDGWLLYDFKGSNSLAYQFLEIPKGKGLTRRFFYWIPRHGEPVKIVSLIEQHTLDHLPGIKKVYRSWQELEKVLFTLTIENRRIAMEYSPYNSLPIISKVDAGTIDLIRCNGAEVISSANLIQRYTSIWSDEQVKDHLEAARVLEEVADLTWAFIGQALGHNKIINEYDVQQFILTEIEKRGCTTLDLPTCAVNANSADPHYFPRQETASPIRAGDFILIDLWCKRKKPKSVCADITRVGVAAAQPTARQQDIFHIVQRAQQESTQFIRVHYEKNLPLEGWQVDQFCRDMIKQAGYGEFFIHRTGHSIGEDVHGPGANLDNFETHDFRVLLPGTGFSIEPGIYLPGEFGVRLEYDVYLDPAGRLMVTGGIQERLVCLG